MSTMTLLLIPLFALIILNTCDDSSLVLVEAFSASTSSSGGIATVQEQNFNKIRAALLSPSGKLTLSPELFIPEPKDPTALLLLTDSVQKLSSRIRSGQANTAFFHGTTSSLQTFTQEQVSSFGAFPGPVPVIYCGSNNVEECITKDQLQEIVHSGAQGVLISIQCNESKELDGSSWQTTYQDAIQFGLQPIPEILFDHEFVASFDENDVENLINKISELTGQQMPAACVFTISKPVLTNGPVVDDDDDDDEDDFGMIPVNPPVMAEKEEKSNVEEIVSLPSIPKSISKKIPILGSIRSLAGENRLSIETASLKKLGYTGAVLRNDCIPGYSVIQLDLDIISQFWAACITDLKSTKSKNFGFRAKNNMEMTSADKWMRYRKNILDSGALGDPNDSSSMSGGMDSDAGDYQGFA